MKASDLLERQGSQAEFAELIGVSEARVSQLVSVDLGQAEEIVKRQASVVTGSNAEDGAAEAIERFILAKR